MPSRKSACVGRTLKSCSAKKSCKYVSGPKLRYCRISKKYGSSTCRGRAHKSCKLGKKGCKMASGPKRSFCRTKKNKRSVMKGGKMMMLSPSDVMKGGKMMMLSPSDVMTGGKMSMLSPSDL